MRIGIICFQHESNTFVTNSTTIKDFNRDLFATDEKVREGFAGSHHEVAGFFQRLDEDDIEVVPLFAARATPGGTLTHSCLVSLWTGMKDRLLNAGHLDGLLLAPHGAAVSSEHHDVDGWWLSGVRGIVGPTVPIVCTLDPHANLTHTMVESCDATVAYSTNPHVDQKATGYRAADILLRTVRGEIVPTQSAAFPPVAINIERQLTSENPCRPLYALAKEIALRPGVVSTSVILGYPYADVPEMRSSFLVVTDRDRPLAEACAAELANYLVSHREAFRSELIGVEGAIALAVDAAKPVCLLDMGDNIGGGSPADGTFLAQALHRQGQLRTFVALFDPEAAARAFEVGVGHTLRLAMGAKTDRQHGEPLEAAVRVKSLHDGVFHEPEPRHGGKVNFDMGPTAVVEATESNLTIMLTSVRTAQVSLQQLTSCNLNPLLFDVIVAKGVHAPVAAFKPVCPTLIRVNTPGSTTADMDRLDYHNRSRPLFPFEEP